MSHFLCLQNKVQPSVPISYLTTLYSPALNWVPPPSQFSLCPAHTPSFYSSQGLCSSYSFCLKCFFFTDVCMAASTHHLGIILVKRTSPNTPCNVVLPPPSIFIGHSTSHCSILVSPQHLTVSEITFCIFMEFTSSISTL